MAVTGEVESYLVCPAVWGDPTAQQGDPIRVTDDALMMSLSGALAVADGLTNGSPGPSPEACALYADLPVVIYLETADGVWLAHLPTDSCGHYPRDLVAAIGDASA